MINVEGIDSIAIFDVHIEEFFAVIWSRNLRWQVVNFINARSILSVIANRRNHLLFNDARCLLVLHRTQKTDLLLVLVIEIIILDLVIHFRFQIVLSLDFIRLFVRYSSLIILWN